MIGIRDQTKIQTLENAWRNCGVLNKSSTGDIDCLPISDVRNVENIDYAFAVDEIFKGEKSYIDNVATLETVDPEIVTTAEGTLQNNQLVGTSTGAPGQENKTNLKTMFANNVDLTVNGDSSDRTNGEDIFNKLFKADEAIKGEGDGADTTLLRHTHQQYIAYLDGHTRCFSKNKGETTIGDGSVAAIKKEAGTNEFILDDETTTEDESKPKATGTGLLQTEVAFNVDDDGTTKNILSKTINANEQQLESRGDTQTVSVGSGTLTGIKYLTNGITFSWDGTPCTNDDLLIDSNATFPNNMHFRICHKITVTSGKTLTIGNGAKIGLDVGGSIVINSGAKVNVKKGGKILIEGTIVNNGTITNNGGTITIDPLADDDIGTITNNGTIDNNEGGIITINGTIANNGTINNEGTINTVKDGIDGNPVQGNKPVIIEP
jgi:hypothetical protein